MVFFAQDSVYCDLALPVSNMSQHMRTVYVSGGINPRHVGSALLIGFNCAPFSIDAYIFKAQSVSRRTASYRKQHLIRFYRLLIAVKLIYHAFISNFCYTGAQLKGNSLFLIILLEILEISASVGPAILLSISTTVTLLPAVLK